MDMDNGLKLLYITVLIKETKNVSLVIVGFLITLYFKKLATTLECRMFLTLNLK